MRFARTAAGACFGLIVRKLFEDSVKDGGERCVVRAFPLLAFAEFATRGCHYSSAIVVLCNHILWPADVWWRSCANFAIESAALRRNLSSEC